MDAWLFGAILVALSILGMWVQSDNRRNVLGSESAWAERPADGRRRLSEGLSALPLEIHGSCRQNEYAREVALARLGRSETQGRSKAAARVSIGRVSEPTAVCAKCACEC